MHANHPEATTMQGRLRIVVLLCAIALSACDKSASPPAPNPQDSGAEVVARVEQVVGLKPKPDARALADKELAERVRAALTSTGELHLEAIDVMAKDGRIGLFGTADSERERQLAGKVAGGVAGVAAVTNAIKVVKGS
jgi:osmotically-inducible protein OsmY